MIICDVLMVAMHDHISYINRIKVLTEELPFCALLSQDALLKVKNTNDTTHLLRNALQSLSTLYVLHNVFQSNVGCTSLLIKPCLETNQTQTRPNKSKQSINVSELVTYLLLVGKVKCFPF